MSNIEVFLRGYVLFRVNGAFFFRYSSAWAARIETRGSVEVYGMHIINGWKCFYSRLE